MTASNLEELGSKSEYQVGIDDFALDFRIATASTGEAITAQGMDGYTTYGTCFSTCTCNSYLNHTCGYTC